MPIYVVCINNYNKSIQMEKVLKEIDKLSEKDRAKVLFYIMAKNHIRLKKEDINIRVHSEINDMSILITSSLKYGKIKEL